jgi:hypothetical protein
VSGADIILEAFEWLGLLILGALAMLLLRAIPPVQHAWAR